jgi:hypothetical protein
VSIFLSHAVKMEQVENVANGSAGLPFFKAGLGAGFIYWKAGF